jgi:hypothetical protein
MQPQLAAEGADLESAVNNSGGAASAVDIGTSSHLCSAIVDAVMRLAPAGAASAGCSAAAAQAAVAGALAAGAGRLPVPGMAGSGAAGAGAGTGGGVAQPPLLRTFDGIFAHLQHSPAPGVTDEALSPVCQVWALPHRVPGARSALPQGPRGALVWRRVGSNPP